MRGSPPGDQLSDDRYVRRRTSTTPMDCLDGQLTDKACMMTSELGFGRRGQVRGHEPYGDVRSRALIGMSRPVPYCH